MRRAVVLLLLCALWSMQVVALGSTLSLQRDSIEAANRGWARDATLEARLRLYFSTYSRLGYRPTTRIALEGYELDTLRRSLRVSGSEGFGSQLFTPEIVGKIYSDLRAILPDEYADYDLRIEGCGREISEWVPNLLRNEPDSSRRWNERDYKGLPLVSRVDLPYSVKAGLGGRHLALWASHGLYYLHNKNAWQWQRPALYGSVEDLLSQSIVSTFLIPMLERAGAIVFSPRERDMQTQRIIVDNAGGCGAVVLQEGTQAWQQSGVPGYGYREGPYLSGENPQREGDALVARCVASRAEASSIKWIPRVEVSGDYAVYVVWQSFEESTDCAEYEIHHSGQTTHIRVNQQMGGGIWTYLGTFRFDTGGAERNYIMLSNLTGDGRGVVSADAVRLGGGMGMVARGDSLQETTSGVPCYMEGARYSVQTMGFPDSIYNTKDGRNDYADDINSRSNALNFLSGGSVFNPDTVGLGVPIELSVGVHTDAGFKTEGEYVGTLCISTEQNSMGDTLLRSAVSRMASADLAAVVQREIVRDMGKAVAGWSQRELFHRNYSETRLPEVPSTIVEMLSHQNFSDMEVAHDPKFKFILARAIYKGILRQVASMHGFEPQVQPLPPKNFAVILEDDGAARLSWEPRDDPAEPTAKAVAYVVYTQRDSDDWDNGTLTRDTLFRIALEKGAVYNFKVAAVNDGGESFPTEELAAMWLPEREGTILIVNGFDRLSGPQVVSTPDSLGFDLQSDIGVPYLKTAEYVGAQTNFSRLQASRGESGLETEASVCEGNTFDYPQCHGRAIRQSALCRSFCSASRGAVTNGKLRLSDYEMIDLILGQQILTEGEPTLRGMLEEYVAQGGRLLASGTYLGGYEPKGQTVHHIVTNGSRDFRLSAFACTPLKAAHRDDCFTIYLFDNGQPAGLACSDEKGRWIELGFPLEYVVSAEERAQLMGGFIEFLLDE